MDNDTSHCQCERDDEGVIVTWFIEETRPDGEVVRHYHKAYNPNCPKHGWRFDHRDARTGEPTT
jgi:hypothetical protein